MALDAAGAQSECVRHLVRRPALDVPENEHLLLPGGQAAKRRPNPPARFSVQHLFLWCQPLPRKLFVLEFFMAFAPPLPPARAPAIPAGIHGNRGQPWS